MIWLFVMSVASVNLGARFLLRGVELSHPKILTLGYDLENTKNKDKEFIFFIKCSNFIYVDNILDSEKCGFLKLL